MCLVEHSNGDGGVTLKTQARSSALVPLQSPPEQASHPTAEIFQQTIRAKLMLFSHRHRKAISYSFRRLG